MNIETTAKWLFEENGIYLTISIFTLSGIFCIGFAALLLYFHITK